MHQNLQQQKVFWEFVKAAHIWQKRVFELNLKHKVMNPPIFPNELLASMAIDPTTYVPISSPAGQSDDEMESEPIHSP